MIKKIDNKAEKAAVCNKILRALPDWFGIETAIIEYIENVQDMPFWTVYENEQAVGFLAIKKHFESSAELYVMGVLPEYHRRGLGKLLIEESENYLKAENFEFYQVKTLSESHPHVGYGLTRRFYLSHGFKPIEEFKTLWDKNNPALMMLKKL